MRIALLISFLVATGSPAWAQAPAATPARPQAQAPAAAAPAQTPAPAPARRRPAAPSAAVTARTGMAIMATDATGKPIGGVRITINGPSERSGTTDSSGMLRVTGLQTGTYRLRFTSDDVVTFEREVAVRSGVTGDIDVTLTPAPPPPPPPAPVVAAAEPAPVGPKGEPIATSLVDFLDANLIRNNEPRKETLVACSGNSRSTLVQLNQDQPQRLYENAEVTYYVIAGEGALRVNGKESPVAAGSFLSIPRGTAHELARRGRRPLIVVAEVSGEPCEEPK
jgi:mannose-6-phosphate isomerase-like protein (cupin superfamily)